MQHPVTRFHLNGSSAASDVTVSVLIDTLVSLNSLHFAPHSWGAPSLVSLADLTLST